MIPENKPDKSHIIYMNVGFNVFARTALLAAEKVGHNDTAMVLVNEELRKAPEHFNKFQTTQCPQLECPEGHLT